MTIRELHGIAAKAAMGRYIQTIHIIDGGDEPATVVVAVQGEQVAITADEARFLADLLNEAADRVNPREEDIAECNEIVDRFEEALAKTEVPEPMEPLPSLIAVRNPRPPSPWTPERNEMMRREVPLGRLTREELFAALNGLEGPAPIQNVGRLGSQAKSLGLTWGTSQDAAPAAPEAAQEPVPEPASVEVDPIETDTAPGVAAVPADYRPLPAIRPAFTADRQVPPGVKPMDYEQVKDLAASWGVAFSSWEDLPMVNAKADRIGHPRIERRYVSPRKLHNLDAD